MECIGQTTCLCSTVASLQQKFAWAALVRCADSLAAAVRACHQGASGLVTGMQCLSRAHFELRPGLLDLNISIYAMLVVQVNLLYV